MAAVHMCTLHGNVDVVDACSIWILHAVRNCYVSLIGKASSMSSQESVVWILDCEGATLGCL
jgi:hypothetical protein